MLHGLHIGMHGDTNEHSKQVRKDHSHVLSCQQPGYILFDNYIIIIGSNADLLFLWAATNAVSEVHEKYHVWHSR